MPCGLDKAFPSENRNLWEELLDYDGAAFVASSDSDTATQLKNSQNMTYLWFWQRQVRVSGKVRSIRVFLDACFPSDGHQGRLIRPANPMTMSAAQLAWTVSGYPSRP